MTQVAQMRQPAPAIPPSLLIELTTCPDALAEAQALRYRKKGSGTFSAKDDGKLN
ncbi:hypothetical protein SAMN05216198_2268 [Halopseudomonas litoralis]|uniref:Uncharacterized protein n=1 Tax=Halopseudomonas litoralis TaxID=797277 RepID=A0A1H1TC57_9GAMM|nr:hypothetical protein [Halopseudomonas litoralis]SDS57905.1 hypothetical protein SAMN05216198_2268 [Halopseudomonas litoralis]